VDGNVNRSRGIGAARDDRNLDRDREFRRGDYRGDYGYGFNHGYGYGAGYGIGYPYGGYGGDVGYFGYQPGYGNYDVPLGTGYPAWGDNGFATLDPAVSPLQSAYASPTAISTATIEVLVPDNANVWINGSPTTLSGEDRIFTTPPLNPGRAYDFQVMAQWTRDGRTVQETQTIPVSPGQKSLADFLNP
jgi:uncharacterized protein (TIGR03000 family)